MILNKRNSYQLVKKVVKECEAARLVVEICDGLFELHFQANNAKNNNNHDGTHKTSIIEKYISLIFKINTKKKPLILVNFV